MGTSLIIKIVACLVGFSAIIGLMFGVYNIIINNQNALIDSISENYSLQLEQRTYELQTEVQTKLTEYTNTLKDREQNLNKKMDQAIMDIEERTDKKLEVLEKHDLNKLATAKPGLIETRINEGTAEAFATIQEILDDF